MLIEGVVLHADPARPVFRRHGIFGVPAAHAGDKTGAGASGLDRSIQGGLLLGRGGSIAIMLVSMFNPTFPPFLAGSSVFPAGMAIVFRSAPRKRSPVRREGRRGAGLVGFWQMMGARKPAFGFAATISQEAMSALGIKLTMASIGQALVLKTTRKKAGLAP